MREPTLEQVEKFHKANKRSPEILRILGELNPFVQAWNSPIGKEILEREESRLSTLLKKNYESPELLTTDEKAEIRIIKDKLAWITEKILKYYKAAEEVSKER